MRKEEKQQVIEELKVKFSENGIFYMADASGLTVAEVSALRRLCFQKGVSMRVAKNTLIQKALEATDKNYDGMDTVLKGQTALFFSEVANVPAKIIKEFRKAGERPKFKAAVIDTDLFVGEQHLDALASLKSKEELVGDIIGLLQSPAKNVISALKSSGGKLAGIVKTLSEKSE